MVQPRPPDLTPVLAAAREIDAFCRQRGWAYFFLGGLAVQRWGEPRGTRDADLTIVTGFGSEATFIAALLAAFPARRADAADVALRHRVLPLATAAGVPLDIALGGLAFEEHAAARASDYELSPGVVLRTCSAEDLVVFKAFAARPQDWFDLQGIAARQAGKLDTDLIWSELLPLLELKEDTATEPALRKLLARWPDR